MPIDVRRAVKPGGFAEKWLEYTQDFEYPESFALFGILSIASAAVNGRILVNPGRKPETMPNTFVLLYGPSGTRKSEALMDAAFDMLNVVPEIEILPMNTTPEALRNRLVKMSMPTDAGGKGAARGIVISEEFSTLIGGADYQKHGAKFLSQIWETPRPFETFDTIAHGPQVIRDRYIAIGGCTTPEDFELLDLRALESGLMRRLLVVAEYQKKCRSSLPKRNDKLLAELKRTFELRFNADAFPFDVLMMLDQEARALNEEWYGDGLLKWEMAAKGSKASKFVNSLQVHAFKLAAVIEIMEGGGSLRKVKDSMGNEHNVMSMSAESLMSGLELVNAVTPGTLQVYETLVPTAFARLKARAFRLLAVSGVMRDGQMDIRVGQEAGVPEEYAASARRALIREGRLKRRQKDGMIEAVDGTAPVG